MNRTHAAAPTGALTLFLLATAASGAAEPTAVMDDTAKMNYALGYQLGRDLAGLELRSEALLQGLEDGRSGTAAQLDQPAMESALQGLEARINEQRTRVQAAAAEKAAADGAAFLAENARKPGVQTTASGLQYKVVNEGKGRKPVATDTVTVHYRGTLVDGSEFDSSYKRGQPATFPVSGVIAGWTEALQMMNEGSKWQLAIPARLAYGDRGPLAGQVLLFDVELLSTAPAAK